ncbi:MAG: signal peptidase I [Ktedonobacterales bacterium]|nr:signal peptidase I [Ktedonobacterales bacterium]
MGDEITQPIPPSEGGQPQEVRVVVEQRRVTRRGCCLTRLIGTGMLVILFGILLANTVAPYRVSGPAMQPTLRDGQIVLAHVYTFVGKRIRDPQRGDIVLYHPPDHPSTTVIGRLIALPGDNIEVTSSSVILNGKPLNEPYIASAGAGQSENNQTVPSTTLGTNKYFILGDNRPNSADSRTFGAVDGGKIISQVWVTLG